MVTEGRAGYGLRLVDRGQSVEILLWLPFSQCIDSHQLRVRVAEVLEHLERDEWFRTNILLCEREYTLWKSWGLR